MTHEIINGKHVYSHNGEVVRRSKREYRFALLGLAKKALGASGDGADWFCIGLGNNATALYNSWKNLYSHCELQVTDIN